MRLGVHCFQGLRDRYRPKGNLLATLDPAFIVGRFPALGDWATF
ncbi:MAG TPA: hypothetical protein V6D35_20090 [Candidatus Sericytochromatia bacterium]